MEVAWDDDQHRENSGSPISEVSMSVMQVMASHLKHPYEFSCNFLATSLRGVVTCAVLKPLRRPSAARGWKETWTYMTKEITDRSPASSHDVE